MSNDLLTAVNANFRFHRRPTPLPPDLRPTWRIASLVLLLYRCCRNQQSSFLRIHVLSWALRTPDSRAALLSVLAHESEAASLVVRIEPSLNRAIDFAIGDGLLSRPSGSRIRLTTAGVGYAMTIEELPELFQVERHFLADVGFRVTESFVSKMFG